jgi:hypothetical protein
LVRKVPHLSPFSRSGIRNTREMEQRMRSARAREQQAFAAALITRNAV